MRMHVKFTRRKGGAGPVPVLGTDGAPGVPPSVSPTPDNDVVLIAPFRNHAGAPVGRIAVGYTTEVGAPVGLTAQLWVYDSLTAAWYEVGAPKTIEPHRMTFFDVVSLAEPVPIGSRTAETGGSIAAALVVQDGATPDGEYVFSMGPDLSALE